MPVNPFQTARFQISAAQLRQLPDDVGSEVAFAGRSNAGKSSALNAICAQIGLARTSKTPGRTQLLNVFVLDDGRRLIDLPGYGYAKVPTGMRDSWKKLIDAYLRERESLRGVVLIMDSRHPLKDFDRQMLTYCTGIELPCLLLLTKADKLSRSEGSKTLAAVRKECAAEGWTPHLQLFSAHAKTGVDEARTALDSLLNG